MRNVTFRVLVVAILLVMSCFVYTAYGENERNFIQLQASATLTPLAARAEDANPPSSASAQSINESTPSKDPAEDIPPPPPTSAQLDGESAPLNEPSETPAPARKKWSARLSYALYQQRPTEIEPTTEEEEPQPVVEADAPTTDPPESVSPVRASPGLYSSALITTEAPSVQPTEQPTEEPARTLDEPQPTEESSVAPVSEETPRYQAPRYQGKPQVLTQEPSAVPTTDKPTIEPAVAALVEDTSAPPLPSQPRFNHSTEVVAAEEDSTDEPLEPTVTPYPTAEDCCDGQDRPELPPLSDDNEPTSEGTEIPTPTEGLAALSEESETPVPEEEPEQTTSPVLEESEPIISLTSRPVPENNQEPEMLEPETITTYRPERVNDEVPEPQILTTFRPEPVNQEEPEQEEPVPDRVKEEIQEPERERVNEEVQDEPEPERVNEEVQEEPEPESSRINRPMAREPEISNMAPVPVLRTNIENSPENPSVQNFMRFISDGTPQEYPVRKPTTIYSDRRGPRLLYQNSMGAETQGLYNGKQQIHNQQYAAGAGMQGHGLNGNRNALYGTQGRLYGTNTGPHQPSGGLYGAGDSLYGRAGGLYASKSGGLYSPRTYALESFQFPVNNFAGDFAEFPMPQTPPSVVPAPMQDMFTHVTVTPTPIPTPIPTQKTEEPTNNVFSPDAFPSNFPSRAEDHPMEINDTQDQKADDIFANDPDQQIGSHFQHSLASHQTENQKSGSNFPHNRQSHVAPDHVSGAGFEHPSNNHKVIESGVIVNNMLVRSFNGRNNHFAQAPVAENYRAERIGKKNSGYSKDGPYFGNKVESNYNLQSSNVKADNQNPSNFFQNVPNYEGPANVFENEPKYEEPANVFDNQSYLEEPVAPASNFNDDPKIDGEFNLRENSASGNFPGELSDNSQDQSNKNSGNNAKRFVDNQETHQRSLDTLGRPDDVWFDPADEAIENDQIRREEMCRDDIEINSTVTLTCPENGVIVKIESAAYGFFDGSCGAFGTSMLSEHGQPEKELCKVDLTEVIAESCKKKASCIIDLRTHASKIEEEVTCDSKGMHVAVQYECELNLATRLPMVDNKPTIGNGSATHKTSNSKKDSSSARSQLSSSVAWSLYSSAISLWVLHIIAH